MDPTTNCATFTPESDSFVVNRYEVDNHQLNYFFQLGLFTTSPDPVTITDLAWSQDGSTWNDFATQTLMAGDDANLGYTEIVSLASVMGQPFHVRYTIPAAPINPAGTFAQGDFVSSQLLSNRNGATRMATDPNTLASIAVLKGQGGNRYALVQRDHEDAISVPGPLGVFGVVAGLRAARQLRRQRGQLMWAATP